MVNALAVLAKPPACPPERIAHRVVSPQPQQLPSVSYSAAETLGMTERGIAKVKLEVVQ